MTTATALPDQVMPGTEAERWELIRALGAAVTTPPPANARLRAALELPPESGADHTDAFVLSLPPHAAIYLGAEGKLGGDALDRVAGFWRALGLRAPGDADHLGVMLMLYAELGIAETARTDERGRAQMCRARTALFHEHLASWVPGYLAAISGLGVGSATAWAQLVAVALDAEATQLEPATGLPAALRDAPPPIAAGACFDELLDAMVTPIRSGIVLTQRDLAVIAGRVGAGFRRGERRFALKAMLQQDPRGVLAGLAEHARSWIDRYQAMSWPTRAGVSGTTPNAWWSARAGHSAQAWQALAAEASPS